MAILGKDLQGSGMARFESEESRDAFLGAPRLGILITNRLEGTPIGVPVWFDWSNGVVCMFADKESTKVARLGRDPRASLLVTNDVGEPEAWVAFDGEVSVDEHAGVELASKLAPRYWDLEDPERRSALDSWLQAPEAFCLLTLAPTRIRSGS